MFKQNLQIHKENHTMTELLNQENIQQVLTVRCKDHPDNPRNRKSTFPHPGVIILNEWMVKHNMSKVQLARNLDVTISLVSKLIEGERDISIDLARKLGKIFRNGHGYWFDIQVAFLDGIDEYKKNNA
jgi:addiction module HigA family antidote